MFPGANNQQSTNTQASGSGVNNAGAGLGAAAGVGGFPFAGGMPFGASPFGGLGMFNPYVAGQTQPQAAALNYEEKYKEQLKTMEEMGFLNKEANLKALIATAGNVELAIERMINLLG